VRGSHAMPSCGWCGRVCGGWACPECGGHRMRAVVVGARRTAEELGRAFPSLTVRTSGREEVLTHVPDRPGLVVATPGAEPVAENGFAAAVLRDGWALLDRADLRASEETLRRWLNAAALVRRGGARGVAADGCPGGSRPRRWSVRVGRWWWRRMVRCRWCNRWCAGIRPVSPRGSWQNGRSSVFPRR